MAQDTPSHLLTSRLDEKSLRALGSYMPSSPPPEAVHRVLQTDPQGMLHTYLPKLPDAVSREIWGSLEHPGQHYPPSGSAPSTSSSATTFATPIPDAQSRSRVALIAARRRRFWDYVHARDPHAPSTFPEVGYRDLENGTRASAQVDSQEGQDANGDRDPYASFPTHLSATEEEVSLWVLRHRAPHKFLQAVGSFSFFDRGQQTERAREDAQDYGLPTPTFTTSQLPNMTTNTSNTATRSSVLAPTVSDLLRQQNEVRPSSQKGAAFARLLSRLDEQEVARDCSSRQDGDPFEHSREGKDKEEKRTEMNQGVERELHNFWTASNADITGSGQERNEQDEDFVPSEESDDSTTTDDEQGHRERDPVHKSRRRNSAANARSESASHALGIQLFAQEMRAHFLTGDPVSKIVGYEKCILRALKTQRTACAPHILNYDLPNLTPRGTRSRALIRGRGCARPRCA